MGAFWKVPKLLVNTRYGGQGIPFEPGASLRDILTSASLHVRSGCGGTGSCGLCLVRIESGPVNDCTDQELRRLAQEELRAGVRFACQVKPLGDIRVAILHPPPHSTWRPLSGDDLPPLRRPRETRRPRDETVPLGVAVDLGNTHIRLTIWDLGKGIRLSGRTGLNPQASFGSDVMTRLTAASASPERAREIALQARGAMGEAIMRKLRESG
jgi:uncharacterized 2Fe-2S/4Fe-4S cluster protein (DUF4445 family)